MLHLKNNKNESYTDIEQEINQFAELAGKQAGIKNKPVSVDEYRVLFLRPLETKLQTYIQGVEADKKPLSTKVIALENQRRVNDKNNELQSTLFHKEEKLVPLQESIKNSTVTQTDIWLRYFIYTVIFIISFSEVTIVYQSMRLNQIPPMSAICVALGFGIGLTVITHTIGEWIRKAISYRIAMLRGFIASLGSYLVFLCVAMLRVRGLHQIDEMNQKLFGTGISHAVSPFLFATISTALFIIGLLIYLRYGWTTDTRNACRNYVYKKAEAKKLAKEIKQLKNQIDTADTEAYTKTCSAVTVYEEAQNLEETIYRLGKAAQAIFGRINVTFRQDGLCPLFISNPPELSLQFFQNKKMPQNDTETHEIQ